MSSLFGACVVPARGVLDNQGLLPPEAVSEVPPNGRDRATAKYELRRLMRRAFRDAGLKSLASCGLLPLAGQGAASASRRGDGSVTFAGTGLCGNGLICPVCAPRLAAERVEAISWQVARFVAQQWQPAIVTLTLRHSREDGLSALLDVTSSAWRALSKSRAFRALGVEFVRGTDITFSNANGWHPHMHIVVLVPPGRDVAECCERLLALWRAALAKLGGSAERVALDWSRCGDLAKSLAYTLKGCAAALSEAVSPGSKSGKFGLTVGDLGEAVRVNHDKRAGRLLVEVALALKGRRLVGCSAGLSFEETEPDGLVEGASAPVPDDRGEVIAYFSSGVSLRRLDRHLPEFVTSARFSVELARAVLFRELGPPGRDFGCLWWLP